MRNILAQLAHVFFILCLSILLFGCSRSTKSNTDPNLNWAVSLSKFEVKTNLESIVTITQYNGSYDEVHQQAPSEGNVYLIVNLTINKQGTGSTPFDWNQLTIQDSAGNNYQRSSDDSFLEEYKYTPRMTGLEIKFGEYEGWLCYEIPAQAANSGLTLIYSAEGSQQEIVVKK